jgi:hypothetical protein
MAEKRVGENDRSSDRFADQAQFVLILVMTFILMAAARSVELLLPWKWARRFGSDDKRWFIGRAWEDASTFAELSFMG